MPTTGDAGPELASTTAALTIGNLRPHACELCQRRKVKCDRRDPCSACRRAHVDCIFRAPAAPRRRKKRPPEAVLLARIKRYEELLKSAGVKIDPLDDGHDLGREAQSGQTAESVASEDSMIGIGKSRKLDIMPMGGRSLNSKTGKLIVDEGKSRYLENDLWMTVSDEFGVPSELLEESSEEEDLVAPLQSRSYATDSGGDDLVFGFSSTNAELHTLHPQSDRIFRLWQTFRENVDPLVKLFHNPTVHQLILDASERLENLPKTTEVLMFAIYSCAVTSLSDAECKTIIGEPKRVLVGRYQYATKQALINVGLLKSSDIIVLQAFVLFLLSVRQFYDPRSMWILSGIAIRVGQRIGLHRDGASLNLPLFEVEMRRRLWWQIILLDGRIAELSGSGVSVLADSWDTKIPLNVNDDDLSPDMRELPTERAGSTEMIFCLIRYNVGEFLRHSSPRSFVSEQNTGLSLAEKDRVINELERLIEQSFLRYCDPVIPLHFLAATMARSTMCTMRLGIHHPRNFPDKGAQMPQADKDYLLSNSMRIIEYDNLIQSSKSTQKFLWHVGVYFQWDALIFVLSELCHRTAGEQSERAWQLVAEAFEYHPEILTDMKRALHVAIGNLTKKAWEARETESVRRHQNRSPPEQPRFISLLYPQKKNTRSAQKSINVRYQGYLADEGDINDLGHDNEWPPADISSGLDSPSLSGTISMDLNPTDWSKWNDLLQDFCLREGWDSEPY
ncbi:fungal-specific transcription factor domain-containing protein [Lipomyces starkeyi]|uniref:Zn(2)-C6 fungal-type domain-containing protein n=1 Tax=Lipomyces starkeyi NRRL Y-11557 TaxID=675824 RepID=A0A1E3Q2R4_LIPST|nr:hypothetical protein LIPSTDRAFT_4272 [Lipomyces starkeyi NRRL Y-11557]